jgi:hypothetical protein
MDKLTIFGLFAVSAMLFCYALERRSNWYVFGFAFGCILASVYGFLQGAWPFGLVEAIWSLVAFRRWWMEVGKEKAKDPKGKRTKSRSGK